jgi:hypothetical protein
LLGPTRIVTWGSDTDNGDAPTVGPALNNNPER